MEAFKYKLKKDNVIIDPSLSSNVPAVSGIYAKGDLSKMIFRIEEISNADAMISY